MFSQVFLAASDFKRVYAVYAPLMQVLEIKQRFYVPENSWAGGQPQAGGRHLFIVGIPFNGVAHDPGNGQVVAFMAKDRAAVDRAYDLALAGGGKDEGRPGLRPQYHTDYYGAYFRDTEGNKVCVVCHEAIAGQG